MGRFNRLLILPAVLLLPWLEPSPGRAQPPALPAEPSFPVYAPPDDLWRAAHSTQLPRTAPPTPPAAHAPPRALPPPEPATSLPAPAPARAEGQGGPSSPPSQKAPLELPPPAGGKVVDLKDPPLEPSDRPLPINLGTALRLADDRPLVVAAAQAGAWIAEAKLQQAKVLWLPDFNLGFDYTRHDGNGPDTISGRKYSRGRQSPGATRPNRLRAVAEPEH